MEELLLKQGKERFNFIKENFSKDFLHHRFTQEDFLNKINSYGLIHSWTKEHIRNKEEEDKLEGSLDYSLCIGINKNWGYIDIYYLYDLHNQMIITEITISEE